MSRKIFGVILLAALLALPACATNTTYRTKDFSFYEAPSRRYYTGSLVDDFKKYYQMDIHPVIVLVKTDTTSNLKYDVQRQYFIAVDGAEERQIIYVVYSADGDFRDGYYIKAGELPALFKGNDDNFHAYLINRKNEVVLESSDPIPTEEIERAFPKAEGW